MRIGVTISRDWDDYAAILRALIDVKPSDVPSSQITVVHGASQMDWFVAGVAHVLGMQLEAHPADWDRYGKGAGMVRNNDMVKLGADVWLAFIKDGSRGASHCAALAENAGIPVRRYEK